MNKAKISVLLSVILLTTNCSVMMAARGEREPNLGAFNVGASRAQVEAQLGKAKSSATLPDGTRLDTYTYVIGNEPSAGRAVAHAVMDVLTLFIWEIIGTGIEASEQGETKQIMVTYTSDDTVKKIG